MKYTKSGSLDYSCNHSCTLNRLLFALGVYTFTFYKRFLSHAPEISSPPRTFFRVFKPKIFANSLAPSDAVRARSISVGSISRFSYFYVSPCAARSWGACATIIAFLRSTRLDRERDRVTYRSRLGATRREDESTEDTPSSFLVGSALAPRSLSSSVNYIRDATRARRVVVYGDGTEMFGFTEISLTEGSRPEMRLRTRRPFRLSR